MGGTSESNSYMHKRGVQDIKERHGHVIKGWDENVKLLMKEKRGE